jgi:manganese/iron transport system permease protein
MTRVLVDPFRAGYMQRAMLEMALLSVLAGTAGVYVVLRRLAFIGDTLTHTVFPGVVIALLLHRSLILGALAFGVLSAVLLALLTTNRRVSPDAALAVLLTSFFALGVVLVSRSRSYSADLTTLLFGRVLAVERLDIAQTAGLAAIVLLVLGLVHKELIFRAFDPDAAAALGYRTALLDLVLNLLVALVVVAALKAVGTALAFIVTPAAAARLVTDRIVAMVAVSWLFGALASWLGLGLSYDASLHHGVRLASGPAVVVVLTAMFVVVLACSPKSGFPAVWRRRRLARGGVGIS